MIVRIAGGALDRCPFCGAANEGETVTVWIIATPRATYGRCSAGGAHQWILASRPLQMSDLPSDAHGGER